MRSTIAVIFACVVFLAGAVPAAPKDTERDFVDQFIKRTEKKHVRKLSWISGSFTFNRISESNDYNRFAAYESDHFQNTNLSSLGNAGAFGLDLGIVFSERFAWSVGGEYWLKLGESKSGSFAYDPPDAGSSTVDDFKSEIKVLGLTTGLQYYVMGHPSMTEQLEQLAVRVGGGIGYYQATWNLWSAYENFNLSTSLPADTSIAFKGSSPGYSLNLGADYPLSWMGLAVGADVSYFHLNFGNIAWYNASDEQIVASYDGTADGRVELNLSGVRAKVELKRFFSW